MRTSWRARLKDAVERAFWTAGQQFVAVLLAGSSTTVIGLPWEVSATSAVLAGLLSFFGAIQLLFPVLAKKFWFDLLLRSGKTFAASLGGTYLASLAPDVPSVTIGVALNIAAIATVTAVGKGFLARKGDPDSDDFNPSTLTPRDYRAAINPPASYPFK